MHVRIDGQIIWTGSGMILKSVFSIFIYMMATLANTPDAQAQDKGAAYEARYMLSGFLLRASKVCQGDERHIKIAFSLLDPDELKVFSKNFPKKVAEWMEGMDGKWRNQF